MLKCVYEFSSFVKCEMREDCETKLMMKKNSLCEKKKIE